MFKVVSFLKVFFNQNPVLSSLLSHTCYMLHPSDTPLLDELNIMWQGVKNIKLCNSQYSHVILFPFTRCSTVDNRESLSLLS